MTTTLILAGLLFGSIANTQTLMEKRNCSQIPKTYFSLTDSDETLSIIQNAILNATERITIAISEITFNLFQNYLFVPLSNTTLQKDKIRIILPFDDKINQSLNSIGLSYDYALQTVRNQHAFSLIVCDDNGFMCPFLSKADNITQLVAFQKCQTCADDIQSFIDFYVLSEKDELPLIIPSTLQAKTSAIIPITIGNSTFFTFYNHDDILFPLRITTNNLIEKMFSHEPKELYIFTQNHPMLSAYTGYEVTHFSLYLNIKALLMRNKTKIFFLARNATVVSDKNSVWCHSLSNFPKFEIKVYKEMDAGPDFIVADNWAYIFSHPIKSHDINEHVSLHYATNDEITVNNSKTFFESVWSRSGPCV